MNTHTAPAPTSATTGLLSPAASSAAPATVSAAPAISRRRAGPAPSPSDGRSASAATGGMRTAFLAGPTAAATVTRVPTASPTSAVRGSNVSGPVGSVMPNPC